MWVVGKVMNSNLTRFFISALIILLVVVGFAFYNSSSVNSYEDLEPDACSGVTQTFKQNGMSNECVDADIDKKLSSDKEFYHGYALLDDGETVEFWTWFREDGTVKTAIKIHTGLVNMNEKGI